MIFTMLRTRLREPLFHWIGKLDDESLVIWGLKSRFNQPFDTLEQLKPYRIATTRGSNPDQYFGARQFDHLYRVAEQEQNLSLLFAKRVDLIVSSERPLQQRAKKMNHDFSKMIKLFNIEALDSHASIAFNRHSDAGLIKRYRQAFKHLKDNGTFALLKKKWAITGQ